MAIKTVLRPVARRTVRLLGASGVLRIPFVRRSLGKLPGVHRLLPGVNSLATWQRLHPFDAAHGTDTSGFVLIADLDYPQDAPADANAYGASQPSILRAALQALPPLDSFTFVDLGCGKGRPMLVASEFPFRDIVGVELSASLVGIAERNAELMAQRFPQRTRIRVALADATRFAFPAGNLVIFLANPFGDDGIAGVAAAVDRAIANEPGRGVYVVYYNPVAGHRFDASPLLRRYFAATLPYGADEVGFGPGTDDPVVIWQGGAAYAPIDARAHARIEIVDPLYRVKLVAQ
jgi:SAM-dependent methyltransferase